jgi:hypothetical protein
MLTTSNSSYRADLSFLVLVLLGLAAGCENSLDGQSSGTGELTTTDEECADGTAVAGEMEHSVLLPSATFPNLKLEFGTRKAEYGPEDACVPVSLIMTNTGSEVITLSPDQANEMLSGEVGLYTNVRIFRNNLLYTSGIPIQSGQFLAPGEISVMSTIIGMDRITLHSVPPLGGGVLRRELSLQGPGGAFGVKGLDIRIDFDFGELPSSRVPEPVDGLDFVPGELVVRFHDGVLPEEAEEVVTRLGCHISGYSEFDPRISLTVSIPFDRTTAELISAFTNEPLVKDAYRNGIAKIFFGPPPISREGVMNVDVGERSLLSK